MRADQESGSIHFEVACNNDYSEDFLNLLATLSSMGGIYLTLIMC